MREETSFEDASGYRKSWTAEIRQSWRKQDFEMEEIWGCMDNVLSRMTPRLLTWSERGMSVLSSLETWGWNRNIFDLVWYHYQWAWLLFYHYSRGACFLSSNCWCRRNTQWMNWGGSLCFQVLHYRTVQCCHDLYRIRSHTWYNDILYIIYLSLSELIPSYTSSRSLRLHGERVISWCSSLPGPMDCKTKWDRKYSVVPVFSQDAFLSL